MISFVDIEAAHQRIEPHIHKTPVLTCTSLNQLSGAQIYFKCESLQKTGAFKARGAANTILSLSDDEMQNGVVAHSSGNHGAAVAYMAAKQGINARIVMPSTVLRSKLEAVKAYGGEVVLCEPTGEARESTVRDIHAQTNAHIIHPYNDERVMAGQGTCAKELIEEIRTLDAIIAPIGGGGLISGTAIAAHHLLPACQIFGAEPEKAGEAKSSFDQGQIVGHMTPPATIADGLKANIQNLTWEVIQTHLDDILLVSEDEIIKAMRMVWQYMKIIIEPSSAVAFAALMKYKALFADQSVGLIVTGGNVDFDQLPFIG